MAKFLIALNDDPTFNKNLFQVSKLLFNGLSEHLFVGLLVKDFSYISTISSHVGEPALADFPPYNSDLLTEEDQKKAEVIGIFEQNAQENYVRFEVHQDFRLTGHEVIKQTTYADLLILNYQIFYNYVTKEPDTTLLYQLLKGSRCPVLIIPPNFQQIDNIVFTYDGKEPSVFAIKSFNNLFTGVIKSKTVSVLTVVPDAEEEIKNEKLMLNFVKQHYTDVGLQLLTGSNISNEISNFAESIQNPIVVMGAYGRSHISNLFLPSVARNILKKSSIPLFIAHR